MTPGEDLTLKAEMIGVPDHLIDGLVRYIIDGQPTGDCLRAILANDLMEAFSRADEYTAIGMKKTVTFIYSYAPAGCHGSYAKVDAWLDLKMKKDTTTT